MNKVEINGINYNLNECEKTAEVTWYPNKYSGAVYIPETVSHNGVTYSVTSIGCYAFIECWGLESVNIPGSVTCIGYHAFRGCSGLTSVNIPDSITRIEGTFDGCRGLTDVNIPDSVTCIGDHAFMDCSKGLADVYCYAENMPSTERIVFNNSDIRKATLHVPAASIKQYKTTEPWSDFGTIVAIDEAETQASRPASKAWAAIIKAGMKAIKVLITKRLKVQLYNLKKK